MLNEYFGRIVPLMERAGGEVHQIVGDELMVLFGKDDTLSEHAFLAAHAALALQNVAKRTAADHPDWPRVPRRRVERRGARGSRRRDARPPQARRRRRRREPRSPAPGGGPGRVGAHRRGDVPRARPARDRGARSADDDEGQERARAVVRPRSASSETEIEREPSVHSDE